MCSYIFTSGACVSKTDATNANASAFAASSPHRLIRAAAAIAKAVATVDDDTADIDGYSAIGPGTFSTKQIVDSADAASAAATMHLSSATAATSRCGGVLGRSSSSESGRDGAARCAYGGSRSAAKGAPPPHANEALSGLHGRANEATYNGDVDDSMDGGNCGGRGGGNACVERSSDFSADAVRIGDAGGVGGFDAAGANGLADVRSGTHDLRDRSSSDSRRSGSVDRKSCDNEGTSRSGCALMDFDRRGSHMAPVEDYPHADTVTRRLLGSSFAWGLS
eukprot:6180290-Pleurochrysis_carterae.AAC.1